MHFKNLRDTLSSKTSQIFFIIRNKLGLSKAFQKPETVFHRQNKDITRSDLLNLQFSGINRKLFLVTMKIAYSTEKICDLATQPMKQNQTNKKPIIFLKGNISFKPKIMSCPERTYDIRPSRRSRYQKAGETLFIIC